MSGQTLADLRTFGGYALGLRGFLRRPLTDTECRRRVEKQLRTREQSLLGLLEAGVFAQATSPYRALLRAAGADLGDIVDLLREHGLEGALGRLHDAGVYVTFEEFKGRRPIDRPGLSLSVRPEDFDNPLVGRAFVVHHVGSRGARRTSTLDLVHMAQEATYQQLLFQSFDLFSRPFALWHPVPPGLAGLNDVLRVWKLGKRVDRWFSQTPGPGMPDARWLLLTRTTTVAGRLAGLGSLRPQHVSFTDPTPVMRWIADRVAEGRPAQLCAGPSSAVRVCRAAEDAGVDISGTVFRVGGEPYTSAKAEAIRQTGSRAVSHYAAAEVGWIGVGCADPSERDDVHLLVDKLGIIQRERVVAGGAARVGALLFTTLRPTAPKLLLNVETDDYGTVEERPCGCHLGRLGLTRHLHGIHSYDKLTSSGMTFVGSDLAALVETTLPARFGGAPTDYQLVEREEDGISRVSIVISPRVGSLDEQEVIATVVGALAAGPAFKRTMTSVWQSGRTLEVVRREPYTTATAKILPLHVLGLGQATPGDSY